MTENPSTTLNPTKSLKQNGRRVLHVKHTSAVRKLRTDHESERALIFLKQTLAGQAAHDRPSISLVMRRAIKLYRGHVSSLLGTPQGLDRERRAVRENSHLPYLRKKKPLGDDLPFPESAQTEAPEQ